MIAIKVQSYLMRNKSLSVDGSHGELEEKDIGEGSTSRI